MNRLEVVEQVITCTKCELHAQCDGPVPMRGEPSRIAIVGEAPGAEEDRQGKPFIGPAGKLLSSMLGEVGIHEPTGIYNTVSCYPHGTPQPTHVAACAHNRAAELAYLDPTYVLLLGRVALKSVRPDLELGHGRGRPFRHDGRVHWATYHPAAALRNGRFETGMRADLSRFADMVSTDDPERFIVDRCAGCPLDASWYERDSWLAWCPVHLPYDERPAYTTRMMQLEAERAALTRP